METREISKPMGQQGGSSLSLNIRQWLRKASRLKLRDISKRLWSLAASLPRSTLALRELQQNAVRERKVLRCIILTDRMRDIIAAEPLARHLRSPTEHLVWLVQPRYQDLLRYNPYVDTVQTVSSYTETIVLRHLFKNIRWDNFHFGGYHCELLWSARQQSECHWTECCELF